MSEVKAKASEVEVVKQVVVPEAVVARSASIRGVMEKVGETGVSVVPKDYYKDEFLKAKPDDMTLEHVEFLDKFNTEMIAGGQLALGEESFDPMTKHKGLDRTTMSIPMLGNNSMNFKFDRSRQVPDRNAEGVVGTKTKFGASSAEVVTYGAGSRGDLLKVKQHLAAKALAAFGS